MSMYPTQQHIIYQHDPDTIQKVKSIREQMHAAGKKYMHHRVKIQTIDGHVLEGTIVSMDGGFLYLSVPQQQHYHEHRQFFYPYQYYNPILPLVLYELLAISLL